MEESIDARVLRVAIDAARKHTGDKTLTGESEVDWQTAMAIGSALADEFNVEILGDASQEMGDSPINAWVEFMRIVLSD